jgi:uncharacterized protein (TIGR02145 family)
MGATGPAGPSGGPLPEGLGPYPGEVAMWDGTQWVIRRMYGCPFPGSCNYIGDWDYQGLADESICLWPTNGPCPFSSCDDGNSLTYDDVWDVNGWNCNGTYCNGNCAGLPCDDGDATTFGEGWDLWGSICSGGQMCDGTIIDCSGAGPCAGVPFVLFDAKQYALVEIGSQCWFKENLASDNYSNGDPIPGNLAENLWAGTSNGAQAIWVDESTLDTYGRLYNWQATQDSRGVCPTGFHVPSDEEWLTLSDFLGGNSVAGAAMKSSPSDTPPWDGSNSSGFSGLPVGYRSSDGYFNSLSNNGGASWWSRSFYGGTPKSMNLLTGSSFIQVSGNDPQNGFSVRCVRD